MTALKPNGGDSNPLSRPRAFVLLKSGRRLDPLNPDPASLDGRGPCGRSGANAAMGWFIEMGAFPFRRQAQPHGPGAARARRAANVRAILPGSADPATRGVDIEVCDECRDVELALIGRLAQANVGEGRVNVRRREVKEKEKEKEKEKVADLA